MGFDRLSPRSLSNPTAWALRLTIQPSRDNVNKRQNMRFFSFCLVWGMAILLGKSRAAEPIAPFAMKKPGGGELFYIVEPARATKSPDWLAVRSSRAGTNEFLSGSRVALKLTDPAAISGLVTGRSLRVDRAGSDGLFILQAPDALAALREAAEISSKSGVEFCCPITRRPRRLSSVGAYGPAPNDPYFPGQWHLENRVTNGLPVSLGADLNVREAWPITLGQGITMAFGDSGVQYTHPDLSSQNQASLNLDFSTVVNGNYASGSTNALPQSGSDAHATAVAGLAVATRGNSVGVSGVSPSAVYGSWKIFAAGNFTLDSEQEGAMYQYRSNIVAVQSHSWGDSTEIQYPLDPLADAGISNAVKSGRGGKGVVIVRSAGNDREGGPTSLTDGNSANDDPYANDPREIAVAAAGADGRVASYSSPGACVLVAGPSGDFSGANGGWPWQVDPPNLFTTDMVGADGYSHGIGLPPGSDLANYAYGSSGFWGTSGSTPEIAGVAALMLAANTNMTYRDIQLALAISSRHYDLADPAMQTNGAGLRVSGNVGYGVPDAGLAARLAVMWTNRPAAATVSYSKTVNLAIPQDGYRLVIPGAPAALKSIPGMPAFGAQADQPTAPGPIVDCGTADAPITQNLQGMGALIQRGDVDFYQKIAYAAEAGAVFAVIYDNANEPRVPLSDTDFSPIPATSITMTNGLALQAYIQTNKTAASGQLLTLATNVTFAVPDTLVCEHVHLRVNTTCPNRSGLRIVLTSPMGTRSVLQRINQDTNPGPRNWTYMSTQHFFESSAGNWRADFSYEQPGTSGSVTAVTLSIDGVKITDTDHDGLDDNWELGHFGNLSQGPAECPAGDGWPNSVKQALGANPNQPLFPFTVDLSYWDATWARLGWPGVDGGQYDVLAPLTGEAPLPVAGTSHETEYFVPRQGRPMDFYSIERQ
jgi:subtilisin-like proprotein convertase family protein